MRGLTQLWEYAPSTAPTIASPIAPPIVHPPAHTAMHRTLTALIALFVPLASLADDLVRHSCSSDHQPAPTAIVERFIHADCEACWAAAPALAPHAQALTLDWLVPSAQGDDAALSAAALPEATERLHALGRPTPAQTDTHVAPLTPGYPQGTLRVGQGPAVGGYVGVTLNYRAPRRSAAAYHYTVVVYEDIPAGAEGNASPRHIARNILQGTWDAREKLSKNEQLAWFELRPMNLPDTAHSDRIRVAAWVHTADGTVWAAARSHCTGHATE